MIIKRRSPRTGIWHEADLPIAEEQLVQFLNGGLIQCCFPQLNDEQREFIQTGYTPEDWAKIFGGEVPASDAQFVVCAKPELTTVTIQG